MVARRALGIRGMVSYAIITRLRRTAIAVAIASAAMLAATLATRVRPAGPAPREIAGAIDWNGWIAGASEGMYTFAVPAGGGAQVAINGRIVSNGASATPVHLDPSPRAFDFQDRRADASHLDVTWSREGSDPSPIPQSVLFARRPSPIVVSLMSAVDLAAAVSQWMWVMTLVVSAAALAWPAWRSIQPSIEAEVHWSRLRWILLASIALNAIPIWWGLPAIWPPDELMPTTWLRGLEAHFSNGWFDRWPPMHYYVLTLATSPVLLLNALGRIDYSLTPWPQVLTIIDRLVSVAAAAGTLIATAIVAARVFGRRSALFAAAIFALAVPFPYYAKTANLDVPYVFWFAVSLVFYFRLLEAMRVGDAVVFAAMATLAICTKDQAYALYPLMAVAIAIRAWRTRRLEPLMAGVSSAVVIFVVCHNLFFNWSGFLSHIRFITGPGNENYRVFAPSFSGRVDLLRLTLRLVKDSWGWPITVVCAAGVIYALFVRRCAAGFALIAPLVSYYLAFVNVILYNYDRFVLPMTLILSIFGGFAVDRFVSAGGRTRLLRAVAVGAMFAYSLLYAATIDALMLHDSRSVVERWVSERLRPGEAVAISGPRELEPHFRVPYLDVSTRADLERLRPAYYVLSADYARAAPGETEWGQLIAALQSGATGYTLVARVRCAPPWPWLPDPHPELVGSRSISPGGNAVSVLRDINPTLEIYARGSGGSETVACGAVLR
jgi:hypothetical protein